MAHGGYIDTFVDDPLYNFLVSNKDQLRIDESEINQQIFSKLKDDDIVLNDFLISHESDLKDILKESGIKSKYIPRLIYVMTTVQNSQIAKDYVFQQYNNNEYINQFNVVHIQHANNNNNDIPFTQVENNNNDIPIHNK
eukprot:396531_1